MLTIVKRLARLKCEVALKRKFIEYNPFFNEIISYQNKLYLITVIIIKYSLSRRGVVLYPRLRFAICKSLYKRDMIDIFFNSNADIECVTHKEHK